MLLQHLRNFKFNSVLFLSGIVKIFVSNTHKIKHDFSSFSRPSRQRKLDELEAVQQQKLQALQQYRLLQQQRRLDELEALAQRKLVVQQQLQQLQQQRHQLQRQRRLDQQEALAQRKLEQQQRLCLLHVACYMSIMQISAIYSLLAGQLRRNNVDVRNCLTNIAHLFAFDDFMRVNLTITLSPSSFRRSRPIPTTRFGPTWPQKPHRR